MSCVFVWTCFLITYFRAVFLFYTPKKYQKNLWFSIFSRFLGPVWVDFDRFWLYGFSQPVITCSKLTIKTLEQKVKYVQKLSLKTSERRQWCSGVFIVNFEHISHLVLDKIKCEWLSIHTLVWNVDFCSWFISICVSWQ